VFQEFQEFQELFKEFQAFQEFQALNNSFKRQQARFKSFKSVKSNACMLESRLSGRRGRILKNHDLKHSETPKLRNTTGKSPM